MFTALENEIIRILQANLSVPDGANGTLAHVPTDQIINGPIPPPPEAQFPTIAVTANTFEILPETDVSPPRGVKVMIEEAFPANGHAPFSLSESPLEPLRAVEIEGVPDASPVLLRERDDYTVDYVNGRVRLRHPPERTVHIRYFTLQPLQVVSVTRLNIDLRLEIWAHATQGDLRPLQTITAIAMGALAANAPAIDGLLSEGQDIINSGLPSLGTRQVFFIFETLHSHGGTQSETTKWELHYRVKATMILIPKSAKIGRIRYIAAGVAWDDKRAERVLASLPPILHEPVTLIQGVDAATAAAMATLGVTTIGQLTQIASTGQAGIDNAIPRAQIIRDRAREVVQHVVRASPEISNITAFLAQPLSEVEVSDLTEVRIPETTANTIVAALSALLDQTAATDLTLSDLFVSTR